MVLLLLLVVAFTNLAKNGYFQLPGTAISCTSDYNLCTIVLGTDLILYQFTASAYAEVTRMTPSCQIVTGCSLDFNFLTPDGSRSITYSITDTSFKVYSISGSTFTFLQSISTTTFSSTYDRIFMIGNYIMIATKTSLKLYFFNSGTSQYSLNHTQIMSSMVNF